LGVTASPTYSLTWHQAIFTCSVHSEALGGKTFRANDEVKLFVQLWLDKQSQIFMKGA